MRFVVLGLALLATVGCRSNSADKSDREPAATKPAPPTRPKRRANHTRPTPPEAATLTAAQWRADLRHLATELARRHINLFHTIDKQRFAAAVDRLDKTINGMDQARIVTELMRLVAMVGDGHTAVHRKHIAYLQLGLYWFDDGVYVVAAPRGHGWAVGRKLTHVGGIPVDQVIDKLTAIIARDNSMQIKAMMPNYLIDVTVLLGLGITKHKDRADYTLADASGKGRVLTVALGQKLQAPPRATPPPLYRQQRRLPYWHRYVAGQRLLYIAYNACTDHRLMPFAKLVAEVKAQLDKKQVTRVVIDLRHNGGGNSRIIAPLLGVLAAHPAVTRRGKLFVVIGRATFSSAVLNTLELKQRFNAIVVGEPSGGAPSHYGEVKQLQLPSSRLFVSYATKYFKHPTMSGPVIEPDIKVGLTHEDFAAGRDPVMAAILR